MGYFLFDHLVTLYMIQNVEIKNLYKTGQAPWTILKALFVQKMSKHLFVKNVTAGSSTLHSVDSSLNLAQVGTLFYTEKVVLKRAKINKKD